MNGSSKRDWNSNSLYVRLPFCSEAISFQRTYEEIVIGVIYLPEARKNIAMNKKLPFLLFENLFFFLFFFLILALNVDRWLNTYLLRVHWQIKAATFQIKNLYDHSTVDLQASSPFVVIAVRHVGVLLTNVRPRLNTLTKGRWVFRCKKRKLTRHSIPRNNSVEM